MPERATRPDWDSYIMALAVIVATRSHDPDTKHGAILADHNHRIIGVGYNGFPRGGDESLYPTSRPEKYGYMLHAELNALLNCALRPCLATLYVTGLPCSRCMQALIQSGVKRVVYGGQSSVSVGPDERGNVDLLARNHSVELVSFPEPPVSVLESAIALARAMV